MKLQKLYYSNGWFAGYYIQDSRGINWAVFPSAKEAYNFYKKLTAWNYD